MVRVRRGKLLKYSGAGMPYLVRLTGRALRDMEAIYEINEADASKGAFAWFNVLAETVYSLERSPERGAAGTTRILTISERYVDKHCLAFRQADLASEVTDEDEKVRQLR